VAEIQNPKQSAPALLVVLMLLCVAVLAMGHIVHWHRLNEDRRKASCAVVANSPSVEGCQIAEGSAGKDDERKHRSGLLDGLRRPSLLALEWTHGHVLPNWGWSILLVTLLLHLALLPTRLYGMRAQRRMQRIQPQMDAIKQRFQRYAVDDPRRRKMGEEMLALQRREGINVFAGIVPLLVQGPVLYGFYRMLQSLGDLRYADWLWCHNLAAPDPWHILPVVSVASVLLMQWLTPVAKQAGQPRWMMFLMPVFGGFMTWHVAAGPALFWCCGNLLGVVQQLWMNRTPLG
jgi:YidC/Oxa1 family membrane protein insertase